MALSGVREMSLIATPPLDRLAVRTFAGPWDGVVLREAIQREMFRGGQVFVVCPRIDAHDLLPLLSKSHGSYRRRAFPGGPSMPGRAKNPLRGQAFDKFDLLIWCQVLCCRACET